MQRSAHFTQNSERINLEPPPELFRPTPEYHGGGILAAIGGRILNLAGRDLGYHDSGAFTSAERFSPFCPLGIAGRLMLIGKHPLN